MLHLYFLLVAVFSTAIGSPIADAQLPTEEFLSFVPPDLAPSSNKLTYANAVGSQNSNGQLFQDFTVAGQAAPNIPKAVLDNIESGVDDSEKYKKLSCDDGWGVCCQGSDPSSANDYLPCSEKSKNAYAGYEDISSQDPRYGKYCYKPVYINKSQCEDNIFIDLQGDNGLTCYTGCPTPKPDGGKVSMIGNLQDGLQEIVPDWNWWG